MQLPIFPIPKLDLGALVYFNRISRHKIPRLKWGEWAFSLISAAAASDRTLLGHPSHEQPIETHSTVMGLGISATAEATSALD